jgi:bidirectional [NiFe] hydrogenase diaphorase subunit
MAEMVTLTIDGLKIHASAGTTILEAATDANIYIPHLCSNEELSPYGACRLCVVEIIQGERARLVASCIFEVTDGLEVKTNTERVLNVRRLVIELLLSRNNKHPALRKIADELGVKETRFPVEQKGCILCGQCVRTCREVVGVSAIGFSGRGITRKIATPFMESPPDCIACGSCVYVCPVQVIPMKEENGVRTIMKYDYPMQKCRKCGQYFAPKKQLEYFSKITNLPLEHFETCVGCR